MSILKYLVLFIVLVVFSSCSISKTTIQDKNDRFIIYTNGKTITLNAVGTKLYKASGCLAKSIYYQEEIFQFEYISLKNHCTWTGLADGLYQDFLRKNVFGNR